MVEAGLVLMVTTMVSILLAGLILRVSLNRQALLDVPNSRSSHSLPVPRGGGLAIVLCLAAGLGYFSLVRSAPVYPALLLSTSIIAGVGFIDDVKNLPAGLRALIQLAAALTFILVSDTSINYLDFPGLGRLPLGGLGQIAAVIWLVALTNFYNFMDGIDGLAGGEGVLVGLATAGLFSLHGQRDLALVSLVIAGGSLGFLKYNFPPAKMFMGDAGSGTLGFVFGALALIAQARCNVSLWVFVLFLGTFLVDTTVTLIKRITAGEKWYQAHRSHYYQRLTRHWSSHLRVTRTMLVITGLLSISGLVYDTGRGGVQLMLLSLWLLFFIGCCYLIEKRVKG
ncbi:MAG: glycosyltransferase family 4 protein [Deltaproteobacteria bacterium]|nr:glycosyltransferase family 4 protein [Deltaproteobacteria bacterium]